MEWALSNIERLRAVQHAKAFRAELRDIQFALWLPPHWDKLSDLEIRYAIDWLKCQPDMRLRDDGKWEAK